MAVSGELNVRASQRLNCARGKLGWVLRVLGVGFYRDEGAPVADKDSTAMVAWRIWDTAFKGTIRGDKVQRGAKSVKDLARIVSTIWIWRRELLEGESRADSGVSVENELGMNGGGR